MLSKADSSRSWWGASLIWAALSLCPRGATAACVSVETPPCNIAVHSVTDCINLAAGYSLDEQARKRADKERQDQERAQSQAAVEERLGEIVTGLGIENSTAQSAITDFVALFAAAVETGEVGEDDFALSFTLNNPLPLPVGNYKLQAVLNDATVYEPLKEAIPEEGRADRVNELEPGLGDFDDVSLTLAWGLDGEVAEGLRFGREFGRQQQLDYGKIFNGLYTQLTRDTRDNSIRQVDDALTEIDNAMEARRTDLHNRKKDVPQELTSLLSEDLFLVKMQRIKEVVDEHNLACENALFDRLIRQINAAGVAVKEFHADINRREESIKLARFAELINNQPQFLVDFTARVRDEVAGPEEYGVKVQFELPFATNWNDYLRYQNEHCDSEHSYDCWSGFAGAELAEESGATNGDRLALSAEYKRIDSYDVSIGMDADLVTLMQGAEDTMDLSATYGRYLGFLGVDPGGTRFDFTLMYQEVFGSKMRQDRIVAGATLTRRLISGAALVFGINYANKAEFRMESDSEFGANFGLVYRFTDT